MHSCVHVMPACLVNCMCSTVWPLPMYVFAKNVCDFLSKSCIVCKSLLHVHLFCIVCFSYLSDVL